MSVILLSKKLEKKKKTEKLLKVLEEISSFNYFYIYNKYVEIFVIEIYKTLH